MESLRERLHAGSKSVCFVLRCGAYRMYGRGAFHLQKSLRTGAHCLIARSHLQLSLCSQETWAKVGEHRGFWYHTVGQRQGIGLSGGALWVIVTWAQISRNSAPDPPRHTRAFVISINRYCLRTHPPVSCTRSLSKAPGMSSQKTLRGILCTFRGTTMMRCVIVSVLSLLTPAAVVLYCRAIS